MRKAVWVPGLALIIAFAGAQPPGVASYRKYLSSGEKNLLKGYFPEAVESLSKALRYRKTIRVYNDLFLAYSMLDEFEKARSSQRRAISMAKKVKKKKFRNLMLAEFYSGLLDLQILEDDTLHQKDFNTDEASKLYFESRAYKNAMNEVMRLYDKVLRHGRYENQVDDVKVAFVVDRIVTDREDFTLQNLDSLRNAVSDYFGTKSGNLPENLNELAKYMRWEKLPRVFPPNRPSTNKSRSYPNIYNEETKRINAKRMKGTRGWGYDPISGHVFVDMKTRDLSGNPWYQN